MKKWEYLRETLIGDTKFKITEELNRLGAEGWELEEYIVLQGEIHGYFSTEKAFVVMKREIPIAIL